MTYWADLVIEMIPDCLSLDRYFMGRWHLDEPTVSFFLWLFSLTKWGHHTHHTPGFVGTETVTQMCSWGRYDELMFLQDTIPLKAYPAYPSMLPVWDPSRECPRVRTPLLRWPFSWQLGKWGKNNWVANC